MPSTYTPYQRWEHGQTTRGTEDGFYYINRSQSYLIEEIKKLERLETHCAICDRKLTKVYTIKDRSDNILKVCSHCKYIHDLLIREIIDDKRNKDFIKIYVIMDNKRKNKK